MAKGLAKLLLSELVHIHGQSTSSQLFCQTVLPCTSFVKFDIGNPLNVRGQLDFRRVQDRDLVASEFGHELPKFQDYILSGTRLPNYIIGGQYCNRIGNIRIAFQLLDDSPTSVWLFTQNNGYEIKPLYEPRNLALGCLIVTMNNDDPIPAGEWWSCTCNAFRYKMF